MYEKSPKKENEMVKAKKDMKESPEGESSISRPDQLRMCGVKVYWSEKFKLLRVNEEILKENNIFCYEPNRNVIFINSIYLSQLSPGEFVRDQADFNKSINK